MRIAYFDCFAGISGDMVLGAVLDAGADEARFRQELAKPPVEFDLQVSKVVKNGIQATDVRVITKEEHHHRRLNDIKTLIESSSLSETVKARSIAIFERLAEAEGAVHGTSPEDVHFHEVGAVDAIVDIVGSAIGLEMLGIEEVYSSPLPMGHGLLEAAHGKIPLPAPATVEILKGVPVYDAGIKGELVTPTGAAIIRTLAADFGEMPQMTLQTTAYGAGKTEFPFPNVLRLMIGEPCSQSDVSDLSDMSDRDSLQTRVAIVETNIDDMNPEFYDLVFEQLFKAGALDVYLTPIYMKKNRPANLLTAICPIEKKDDIAQVILTETTTFGVRISIASRRCLERKWETVSTRFGEIRMKIGLMCGKQITASPEYEDCKKAAEAHNVPIRRVYEEAILSYNQSS